MISCSAIVFGSMSGNLWISPTTRLVTIGAASDVPLANPLAPVGLTTVTPLPNPPTSVLILPPDEGPVELNGLLAPDDVTEPTAMIPFTSAGGVIVPHELPASLPPLEI